MAQQKEHLTKLKSTIVKAIGSFYIVSRSRSKVDTANRGIIIQKLIEHNRSAQLDFVQLLNSILKISYMATGLIRNKSHFSREYLGLTNYILIRVKQENEKGKVK